MSCPGFAREAVRVLRANQGATDAVILVADSAAYVLGASFFLAPLAVQVGAVSVALTVLQNDCDGAESLQAVARRGAIGCDIMLAVAAVGGAASTATANVAGIAFFATAGAVFGALRLVLAPLGAGRSPGLAVVEGFIRVAGVAGGYDTTEAVRILHGVNDALEGSGNLQRKAEDAVDEEDDGTLRPMFSWSINDPPPGFGSSASSVFNAYSHAYQEAAAAAYAVDPNADLRPWLSEQAGLDVVVLRRMAAGYRTMAVATSLQKFRRFAEACDNAMAGLGAWLVAADDGPPGAWPPSTLRRVIRSNNIQNNLPVVVDSGDEGDGDGGGGGSSGWVLPAGFLLLVAAASR